MPSFSKVLGLSVLLAGAAHALPTGAPKCAINPSVIAAAHHAPSDSAGYTLTTSSTTYTPGQKITVKLIGTTSQVAGVLMYATPGTDSDAALAPNGSKTHVGVFNVPTGFRAQTTSICDGVKITQEAPESTITHSGPAPKGKEVTFEWTAPASGSGPITFNAAIASGEPGNPWQVLPIVTLQSAGDGGSTGSSSSAAEPMPTAAPVPTETTGPTETFSTGGIATVTDMPTATVAEPAPTSTETSSKQHKCHKKGGMCHKTKKSHGHKTRSKKTRTKHQKKTKGGAEPTEDCESSAAPEMTAVATETPVAADSSYVATEPAVVVAEATEVPVATDSSAQDTTYPSADPSVSDVAPVATEMPVYPAPSATDATTYPSADPSVSDVAPVATEMPVYPAPTATDAGSLPSATATSDNTTVVFSGSSFKAAVSGWVTLAGAAIASGLFLLA